MRYRLIGKTSVFDIENKGSIPFISIKVYSSKVEHSLDKRIVVGSSPAIPNTFEYIAPTGRAVGF